MSSERSSSHPPKGLAFDLSDLVAIDAWAADRNIHLVVELDTCVGGDSYEEVLAFHAQCGPMRDWIMWRTQHDVVVQPLAGNSWRFPSVSEALDVLNAVIQGRSSASRAAGGAG